jgi:hypothetical protein
MSENFVVSEQWAKRPMDQRFATLGDLRAKVAERKVQYLEKSAALEHMQVQATDDGGIVLADKENAIPPAMLTHWAFGQLCARAGAPAGYLRKLPAELATMDLQWSMETHEAKSDDGNDAKLLIQKNGATWLRAVTSPTYGRIYDLDVVDGIIRNVDQSIWRVPSASYTGSEPLRATTIYGSDHDIFVFLVDEGRTIEADGEALKRGFYCWNSEVGATTFGLASFTYDRVCDNRIIWNCGNFKEMTIRHTSGGPHRFLAHAAPTLRRFAESSGKLIEATIVQAKATQVGKDRKSVLEWMSARGFTKPQAAKAYDAAEADPRGYDPRTVWALVQGVTDSAHSVGFQDDRVDLEAKAGKLLDQIADKIPAKETRPSW